MSKSSWSTWNIKIKYLEEREFKTISHIVKARSKKEAENKAYKFLCGRGSMLFQVYK